ncbi:MAG: response regulator [Calditrichia bacterium]
MNTTQKRVLIVDDEEDLTWTLNKKLSKDSDKFQIMTVNSGKEAMNVLSQVPVDLLISDVRMPEVSGLELLVETKKKFPRTRVIIMTAYGSSDVQREANERGCFRYLEKPFEINDLREMILEALTEKKGFKGSVADFQLSDIIQLNCLGRITSSLQIKHKDQTGLSRGTDFVLVHNTAGFAITFLPETEDGNLEASDLGSHLSVFFEALNKFQQNLQTTAAMLLEIQFGNLIFVTARVPDKDAWVTVLGDPGVNVGFVRLELRKAVKKISAFI